MPFGFSAQHILLSILRVFQFVLAVTVCGLYGVDLHAATVEGRYQDSKWLYAVVVAGMSACTAVIYCIPFIARIPMIYIWDAILFLLWVVVFGIFGKMYISENPENDSGVQRMKNSVWVDLVNVILWLISAAALAVLSRMRRSRAALAGKAQV